MASSTRKSFVVFCRHGQRAPGRHLLLPELKSAERPSRGAESVWSDLIFDFRSAEPAGNGGSELNERFRLVSDRFPVIAHSSLATPSDHTHFPYGALTQRGVQYMQRKGEALGELFPQLAEMARAGEITALATNYRRTQISAQFLLHGLTSTASRNSLAPLPVSVLSEANCPLSFYENRRLSALARELVKKVQRSPAFAQRETEMASVKKAMLELVPNLMDPVRGFDWPTAFDYYTCAHAHNMPIHSQLAPFEEVVLRHFVFRYWNYYRDAQHAAQYVYPLLERVISFLTHSHTPSRSRSPSVSTEREGAAGALLLSAHDITIFALLSVLGAQHVVKGPFEMNIDPISVYDIWPHYGKTLVAEVSHERDIDDTTLRFFLLGDSQEKNAEPVYLDAGLFAARAQERGEERSTEETIARNYELLQQRRSEMKTEVSLRELRALLASLRPFVTQPSLQ